MTYLIDRRQFLETRRPLKKLLTPDVEAAEVMLLVTLETIRKST